MSEIDKILDFDSQPLSMIMYNLIKWFNVDTIETEFSSRPEVESRVWITVKITKGDKHWYVDGQRNDIVKDRLIRWYERFLKPKP